jgi:PadR family transcriptional regulator PadR
MSAAREVGSANLPIANLLFAEYTQVAMEKRAFLGDLEQLVLLALVRLKDKAYGAAISREIEARAKRRILGAAVYTALDRLEEKGYIGSAWGEATSVQGGRAKKFYTITPSGDEVLGRSLFAINEMQKGLKLGFSRT